MSYTEADRELQRGRARATLRNVTKLYRKSSSFYYYYLRGLRVFSSCEDVAKDRNTRVHLVCTVGDVHYYYYCN